MYKKIIYKNKINEKLIIKLTRTLDIKEITYIQNHGKKIKLEDLFLISEERKNKLTEILKKFSENLEENYKKDLKETLKKYKEN